jgi:hypothetical protein
MTIELRKLMREVFLVGYTRGSGKEKLKPTEEIKAQKDFEKFFLALKNQK